MKLLFQSVCFFVAVTSDPTSTASVTNVSPRAVPDRVLCELACVQYTQARSNFLFLALHILSKNYPNFLPSIVYVCVCVNVCVRNCGKNAEIYNGKLGE